MIRFSAVLVAAAIAVLVAGIATSKLLLVYVAIAASAAALVALAIGVVLKREELFGSGQRLAPEPARADVGGVANAGASNGTAAGNTAQDRSRVPDHAYSSGPSVSGQAGSGQAGSGAAQPALAGLNASRAGSTPSSAGRPGAPGGQWREAPADQAPPWGPRPEPDRSPRPAWAPPAQEPTRQEPARLETARPEPARPESARPRPGRPEPAPGPEQPVAGGAWRPAAAWLDTSTTAGQPGRPDVAQGDSPQATVPGGRLNAWGTPDAAETGYAGTRPGPVSTPGATLGASAGERAPQPWADSWAQQSPRTPDVKPAGPSVGLPSWFDRPGTAADEDTPAVTGGAWDRPAGRHATPGPSSADTPSATRVEPAMSPTRVEPAIPPTRVEPALSGPAQSQTAVPQSLLPEPAKSGPSLSGPSLSGPARPEPAVSEPVLSEPVLSEPAPPAAGETPAETVGVTDDDDDWPTRYAWLDEDPEPDDEASRDDATTDTDDEPAARAEPAATPAAPVTSAASAASAIGDLEVAAPTAAAPALGPALGPAAGPDIAEPDVIDPSATRPTPAGRLTKVPPPPPAAGLAPDPEPDETARDFSARAWAAEPAPADVGDDGRDSDASAEPGTGPDPAATAQADVPPAAGEAVSTDGGSGLVTVVPGVPRFHEPDCILIRFMPEKDIQKLTTSDAKAAGCTPCAACQPAG